MDNETPFPEKQFLLAFYAPQFFEEPFYHTLTTSNYNEAKNIARCFYGDYWIYTLFYRERKNPLILK